MNNLIDVNAECSECGNQLTKDNYHGWYKIILNDMGFEIKEPVCDKGAY
jgi:hypothetical protein